VESTLKKLKQSKYELTVELGREELDVYVKAAETNIAASFQMDGFRRGKVPPDIIRKEVGDKVILEEAMKIALNDSLARTLNEQKLEVMKVLGLDVKENSASKLVYSASIMVFPPISIGNLAGLKIKRRETAVDRKEVEEAVDFLRASRSKTLPQNKPIEKGDRVEIDFEVTSDGLPIEGGVSKNHPLIVGENKFIPGFEDQLVGLSQGQEKKFSLAASKEYFHKNIAGKKLDFTVRVIKVEEIRKLALTDDFARSLGRFKDLNDLEHNVSRSILEEKKFKESQRLRLEILSNILGRSKIEIPEDMTNERLDEMVTGFDNDLHTKGMELSMYLAHLGKTEDDLRKDWRPEAEKQVAFALIIRKIAKNENIKPEPQEIEEGSEKMLQSMAIKGELREEIDPERLRESVANNIINEKVFRFLENNYSV